MQALGGYAQLPEYDMERYFHEAKHSMGGGGTNEIQRSIIAKEMGLWAGPGQAPALKGVRAAHRDVISLPDRSRCSVPSR
jgi:hypothetical protein